MKLDDSTRDALIARVYGAAVGRQPWESALALFREATDGWTAQLLAIERRNGAILFSHSSGAPAEAHLDYVRTYHRIDPRMPLLIAQPGAGWAHCHELMSEQQVAADPFYQEFLIPHGGRYVTGTKLVDDDQLIVILAVIRGVGSPPIEPETLQWMSGVRSHFVEAIANYRHLASLHLERSIGHVILDGLRQPVVLVDAARALHYANAAARDELQRSSYIVDRRGALGCPCAEDDAALATALQSPTLFAAAPDSAVRRHVRLRGRGDGRQRVTACLSPLRPADVMGLFGTRPLAMILFHEAGRSSALDPFVVAEVFDLTPAEAQVAVLLAHGRSIDEITRRRQVSIHTVRAQVKAALAKTEAASIADLVRRVLSLSTMAASAETTHELH